MVRFVKNACYEVSMINPAACPAVKEGKSDRYRGGMFVGLWRHRAAGLMTETQRL